MDYLWTTYYKEFANRLLQYKQKHSDLLAILKASFDEIEMKYPFMERGKPISDICPFTVFGSFNKGISDKNRTALMQAIGNKLGMKNTTPSSFAGIPVLNNLHAWFFGHEANRKPDDISNLWDAFEAAIAYADNPTELTKNAFIASYDRVRGQYGVKWNLTMGHYWIRPFSYLNLDACNRNYLTSRDNSLRSKITTVSNLKQPPSAKAYLELISVCQESFKDNNNPYHSFPELSHEAWKAPQATAAAARKKKISKASFSNWFAPLIAALKTLGGSAAPEQIRNQIILDMQLPNDMINGTGGKARERKFDDEVTLAGNYLSYEGYIDSPTQGIWRLAEKGLNTQITDEIAAEIITKGADTLKKRKETGELPATREPGETHLWIYSPGEGSSKWDEFYSTGIMGLGWGEIGDLSQYQTRDSIRTKMKELYGGDYSFKISALAAWQFANDVKIGDIVYAKKGQRTLVGRGIVQSDYIFDAGRSEHKHIHRIKWTHNGEWEHPGKAVSKILTDITSYIDYAEKLENLFADDPVACTIREKKEITYDPYTEEDFLDDVFMDADRYYTLIDVLKSKKNLILQGAPGVGKTYVAKRLAYSIIGKKDSSRVMMIQFHQSYSYEDFIMGFRPAKDGFELVAGPFYQFCKAAEDDNERDYFFIIDEINRGNLSKIFGELLMLVENDKRGEKMRLLYSNELFSVPANLYLIGMMNTADRSLAMIDYALRRRFAFFELEPGFDSAGFQGVLDEAANPKLISLVEQIKALNDCISKDESLGAGFRIGHSYLCASGEVSDEWLMAVVNHEIIPLLKEYWFDEQAKIEEWTNKLCGALDD